MSDVYFTTNPSDFSKLEGLYVSERRPPGFIRGQDLSTIGIAGRCVRGPDEPQEITSSGRFLDIFGGRDQGSGGPLLGQVWAALLNKAFGPLVVRRVRAADSIKASFTLESAAGGAGAPLLRIDASSAGAWGNLVGVKVSAATDGDTQHFNLTLQYRGKQTVLPNVNITAGNDNTAALVGGDVARLVDLVKLADGRPNNTTASADGAGTDGFVLLGQTGVSGFTGVLGTDGTLVVGDYNAGVNDLAVYPGIAAVMVPEAVPTPATFHGNLVLLASQVSDRVFLTWAQTHGQSVATEISQLAAQITTRTDRIVWAFNSAFTTDPETSQPIQQGPHVWLAAILSQIDVDIHAGSADTIPLLAGIQRVTNTALSRLDLIALKNAGISTLERNTDGFQFRSVLTTSLEPGKTELARRRMADFLQLSAASRLRFYVKSKNTPEIRAQMSAELFSFSDGLRRAGRVVKDFSIDSESVNTPAQRSQGEEHLLWRVRLISHILSLVLETDIATGTVIERAA